MHGRGWVPAWWGHHHCSQHDCTEGNTKHQPLAETSFKDLVLHMVTQRQKPLAPNPHIIQTANRNRNGFSIRVVPISCTSNGKQYIEVESWGSISIMWSAEKRRTCTVSTAKNALCVGVCLKFIRDSLELLRSCVDTGLDAALDDEYLFRHPFPVCRLTWCHYVVKYYKCLVLSFL